MKTNKMMRIASVMLIAVLLSTCVISGTFAKYVSTAAGTDSARVAKWQIELNDAAPTAENKFTFDLFSTIKDSDGKNDEENIETDETLIAPGTSGSVTIKLENLSEVSAKYDVTYSVNAAGVPLEFATIATGETANWNKDITTFNVTDKAIDMTNGTDSITLWWRWAFETADTDGNTTKGNTDDTTLGLAGTATPSVTATVNVEQVD